MQKRTALIVAGAVGEGRPAATAIEPVLYRHGYEQVDSVASFAELLPKLNATHYDLVLLGADRLDAMQLGALERALPSASGTSVIATGPRPDPDLILSALRAGIHEFLVRPVAPQDLSAALDRLTKRPAGDAQQGTIIAVYGAKGGLGTTTVAVNLAHDLARRLTDKRVALADLVVGRGDVGVFLNLTPAYDLDDLVARQDRVDADVLYSLLTEWKGMWVLPASDKPESEEELHAGVTSGILQQFRTNFAVTVLDCEDRLDDHTVAALDAADRIVVVTQLTIPILRGTQRMLQLFRRLGYREEKILAVVNRYHTGDAVSVDEAKAVLGRELDCRLPNDFQLCARALSKGTSVVEDEPRSQLAHAFSTLADRLDILPRDAVAPPPVKGRRLPFARVGR